jgi:hypothetical protein
MSEPQPLALERWHASWHGRLGHDDFIVDIPIIPEVSCNSASSVTPML